MKNYPTLLLLMIVVAFLWFSSEAFPTNGYPAGGEPSYMDAFAGPYPVYKFDWAFPLGSAQQDINGNWVNIPPLTHAVSQSLGDGVFYSAKYWDRILTSAAISSFSLSNDIGLWLDAIGTGQATIRYSIREDYGPAVDNGDIIELYDDATELVVMPGYAASGANLGIGTTQDIAGLEWKTDFNDEHLVYDHGNAISNAYAYLADTCTNIVANQDGETLYYTVGTVVSLDGSGKQIGTTVGKVSLTGGNYWNGYANRAHNADIICEFRTYNPTRNPDGPESPYEWLYDASGDMYVPTDGSALPGDTEDERAFKLIGAHPYWVDDDTGSEVEWDVKPDGDQYIWLNQQGTGGTTRFGFVAEAIFVDSWRLAGEMLGLEFWDSGYVWDVPDMRVEDGSDGAVAGYDALNTFMRYVFDIDALVVEDVDDDGEFDVGDDYVLFSVVDDGLYNKYQQWGTNINDDVDAFFAGEYFDGDTIFLYDGTSVTTFFDAGAGIFFGATSSEGDTAALWGGDAYYDLDALDIGIGIIPEPSAIFLMIGSASGLAAVAGIMRRKLR